MPASPSPARRMRVPSSTPAGMLTDSVPPRITRPGPVQEPHGSLVSSPRPPAAAPAGAASPRAVLRPGGDVDRQRALAHHPAGAAAGAARVVDDLAAPLAGGAGALDGEEALAGAHLAGAAASGAGRGLGAGFGAAAGAGLAGD